MKPAEIFAGLFGMAILAVLVVGGVALVISGIVRIARGPALADNGPFIPVEQEATFITAILPSQTSPPKPPSDSQTTIRPFDWNRVVDDLDWFQFEKLVALVLTAQGWQVERRGGGNADGGIDLVARKAGEDDLAVQCKHWKAWDLGVARVREFLGVLVHANLKNGMIIATKGYTVQAAEFARQHQINLLGKSDFVRMLEESDCRFVPDVQTLLNDPTKYCPRCEAPMVLRNGNTQFWGCSRYPACRYTMQV